MRSLLVALGLFLAGQVWAASGSPPVVTPAQSGGSVGYSDSGLLKGLLDGRSYIPKSDGVGVRDTFKIPGPNGQPLELNADRIASRVSMGVAARALMGGPLAAAVVAGAVLWDIFKDYGIERGSDGKPNHDPGTSKIPVRQWTSSCSPGKWDSVAEAQQACLSQWCAQATGYVCTFSAGAISKVDANTYQFTGTITRTKTGYIVPVLQVGGQAYALDTVACPKTTSTLPLTSAATGPCGSTARTPTPPAVLDGIIPAAIGSAPSAKLPDVLRETVGAGQPVPVSTPSAQGGAVPDAAPSGTPAVSGPADVKGPEKTTTGPDGQPTTVRETWPMKYEGNSFTWNNSTVTISNGGTVISTTTTQNPEAKDPCVANPNRAGCVDLGDPSSSDQVQRKEKNISFDPVSVGGAGACPSAVTFAAFGKSYSIEYTPMCDAAATYIKPIVLLLAACSAAFIFVGGLKS